MLFSAAHNATPRTAGNVRHIKHCKPTSLRVFRNPRVETPSTNIPGRMHFLLSMQKLCSLRSATRPRPQGKKGPIDNIASAIQHRTQHTQSPRTASGLAHTCHCRERRPSVLLPKEVPLCVDVVCLGPTGGTAGLLGLKREKSRRRKNRREGFGLDLAS